ncbi:DUF4142 domain-containing protein [Sorangium sp. So ce726]|uniref:DUF4142 domain-containing protein n=1 Tax=Sorangium sp. So ce726 TaxID=3133319 RepID=UPI003F5FFF5A
MAIMFAGSFVLAGAGGCIGSSDDAEADRDGNQERTGAGPDGRSHGQTGRDGARGAGGRGGRAQAGGRQGGERAGGQRAGDRQMCGEEAGYQGGRQGGRGQIGSQGGRQGGRGERSATQQPSDAELTMLISFIHQKEVDLSQIALDKAESPDVKRYAEQIVEEHSQSEQIGAGSRGSRFKMESCSRCRELDKSSTEVSGALEEEEGAEFDTAFIWAEISFHRRALELLDMPRVANAENAKIRTRVKAMRADVEQHLTEAQQLFCLLLHEQQAGDQQQRTQQEGTQPGQQQRGQFGWAQTGQQQGIQVGQQQGVQTSQMQPGQRQGTQIGQQQRGQQQRGQASQMQPGQRQGTQLGQQQRGQQQRGQASQMQPGQRQSTQIGQQQRGQVSQAQPGQQQRDQFGRLQTGQQQPSQQQGPQAYAQRQGESQKSQ